MRILFNLFVISWLCLLTGCREDIWYSVSFKNCMDKVCYDGKVEGWPGVVFANSGVSAGVTTPVPDRIVISWKTVKPEKEEFYKNYIEERKKATNGLLVVEPDSTEPAFPGRQRLKDVFENHKVEVMLKGKVPRHLQGEIFIKIHENDRIEVSYTEKQIDD